MSLCRISTMTLSEALTEFEDSLPDIRKACVENIQAIERQYQPYKRLEDDDEFTREAIHAHANYLLVQEKTAQYVRVIKRIDSRKRNYSSSTSITEDDIARAKDVPLVDLYDGQLFGSKRKYGLCPFHDERSPSFYINTNNRFKCFGCQLGGDSIAYIMHRDSVPFVQAVKTLRGC